MRRVIISGIAVAIVGSAFVVGRITVQDRALPAARVTVEATCRLIPISRLGSPFEGTSSAFLLEVRTLFASAYRESADDLRDPWIAFAFVTRELSYEEGDPWFPIRAEEKPPFDRFSYPPSDDPKPDPLDSWLSDISKAEHRPAAYYPMPLDRLSGEGSFFLGSPAKERPPRVHVGFMDVNGTVIERSVPPPTCPAS